MESHPEEFTPPVLMGTSKWSDLIHAYKEHIDAEDYEALKLGMKKVLQDKFTERVMQMLAGVDETSEEGKSLSTNYSGTAPLTWVNHQPLSASLTIGDTTIDESALKHLKAHLDAHKELAKPKARMRK
jgi:hypothetical protein